jgi:hypothetical protein
MDIFGGASVEDGSTPIANTGNPGYASDSSTEKKKSSLDHNTRAAILAFTVVLVILLVIQQIILAIGHTIARFFHDLFNSDISYVVILLLSSAAAFSAYHTNDNKSFSDHGKNITSKIE